MAKSNSCLAYIKKNSLTLGTLIGSILGLVVGIILVKNNVDKSVTDIVSIPGELFIRCIYMIIPLLVVTSVVSGMLHSKDMKLKKIGSILTVYCLSTTTLAGIMGVVFHFITTPFLPTAQNISIVIPQEEKSADTKTVLLDILRNGVPKNIIRAFFQTAQTVVQKEIGTNGTINVETRVEFVDGVNMCGLIVFSILFGLTLRRTKANVTALVESITGANVIFMELLSGIMKLAPVAVLFLIAGSIGSSMGVMSVLQGLVTVFIINVLGLLFHCLVFLNILLFIFTKRNPFRFALGVRDSMLTAWATMSSAATLPVTITCMEENVGVKSSFARLVLPIMATINMDGGAMMTTQVSLFFAHLFHIPITPGMMLLTVLMSAITSIGAAAVPAAGLIALLVVLSVNGVPTHYAPLILSMDFIFDRFRTASNVYGDCVGVAIVQALHETSTEDEQHELNK